jgi:HK97 family phage portal protein
MRSIAIRSTIDLIASLCSELPAHVYQGEGAARRDVPMPDYLLDPSGDGHGLQDWTYQFVESWCWRGNTYGNVLATAAAGYPTQIDLYYPDDVTASDDGNGGVRWTVMGKPAPPGFRQWRVNPVPGRVLGLSPLAAHATQIGLSLTSTQFGLQWFKDGAHPTGILSNSEENLNQDKAKTVKERFMAALRGSREPIVLGKGWSFEKIQLTPEESQFLDTQGYSEAQCCRIYGPGFAEVLGYDSGGSMTYSNVESRAGHLLVFSMNKWLRRIERVLSSMLPRDQYVRIDRDALLQATPMERFKAHEIALRNRWRTVNEVRDDEDMPSVEWGDEPNPNYIGESTSKTIATDQTEGA